MKANNPGWKTSEFWVAILTTGMMVATQGFGISLPTESILSITSMAMSYIFGRNFVKGRKGGE